jgi:hypothetical protein
MIKGVSKLPKEDLAIVPDNTNRGESQHHIANGKTGKNLTLVEGIVTWVLFPLLCVS